MVMKGGTFKVTIGNHAATVKSRAQSLVEYLDATFGPTRLMIRERPRSYSVRAGFRCETDQAAAKGLPCNTKPNAGRIGPP